MDVVGSDCRSLPVLWAGPRLVGSGDPVCMAKQQTLIGATKINNPAPHNGNNNSEAHSSPLSLSVCPTT